MTLTKVELKELTTTFFIQSSREIDKDIIGIRNRTITKFYTKNEIDNKQLYIFVFINQNID